VARRGGSQAVRTSILGNECLIFFGLPMNGLTSFIGDSKKVRHSSPRICDATRKLR